MKLFKTKEHGEFSCTLVDRSDGGKTLSFHGVREHEHVFVPPGMIKEAGRLYRRDCGEAMLKFAERAIDVEVGSPPGLIPDKRSDVRLPTPPTEN